MTVLISGTLFANHVLILESKQSYTTYVRNTYKQRRDDIRYTSCNVLVRKTEKAEYIRCSVLSMRKCNKLRLYKWSLYLHLHALNASKHKACQEAQHNVHRTLYIPT